MTGLIVEVIKGILDVIRDAETASRERKQILAERLERFFHEAANNVAQLISDHEAEHKSTLDAFAEARKRLTKS